MESVNASLKMVIEGQMYSFLIRLHKFNFLYRQREYESMDKQPRKNIENQSTMSSLIYKEFNKDLR